MGGRERERERESETTRGLQFIIIDEISWITNVKSHKSLFISTGA